MRLPFGQGRPSWVRPLPLTYGRAWVLVPTDDTADCRQCDSFGAYARFSARWEADRLRVREWVLAAPRFTDDLLAAARARHGLPLPVDRYGHRADLALVAWADTLDSDSAAYWLTGGSYPPVSHTNNRLLAADLSRRGAGLYGEPRVLDIGAAYGLRGFPWPPVRPDLTVDSTAGLSMVLDAGFRYVDGSREPVKPGEKVTRLPDGYARVLTLKIERTLFDSIGRVLINERGFATGSLFTDDDGHVVVLWQ